MANLTICGTVIVHADIRRPNLSHIHPYSKVPTIPPGHKEAPIQDICSLVSGSPSSGVSLDCSTGKLGEVQPQLAP